MTYQGIRGYLKNINLLWHIGYYDGPISGVAELDGYKVYFEQMNISKYSLGKHEQPNKTQNSYAELMSEYWFSYYFPEIDKPEWNDEEGEPGCDYDIIRFYYAYDISDNAMFCLVKQQELFEKYVGRHNLYRNNSRKHQNEYAGPSVENNWEKYKELVKEYKELVKEYEFDKEKEIIFRNRIGYFDSNTLYKGK